MVKSFIARNRAAVLAGIVVLGLALRLHALGANYFWFDEAMSIFAGEGICRHIAEHGFWHTICFDFVISAPHAVLVQWWRFLAGDSDFALRILPVFFSTASVVVIYRLGKVLFTPWVGLTGAFLLSVSPYHIYHAQELKLYAMMTFLALLSAYFLVKWLRSRGSPVVWASGYVIVNVLNIYSHHMAVFALLAQAAYSVSAARKRKHGVRGLAAAHCAIAVLLIPWVINVLTGTAFDMNPSRYHLHWFLDWILPHPDARRLLWVFKAFSIGYNARQAVYVISTAVFLALAVRGLVRGRRQEGVRFLAFCVFLPVAAAFVIGQVKSCFIARYLIPSSAFFYLLVAFGLLQSTIRFAVAALTVIAVCCGAALGNYYANDMPGSGEQFVMAIPKIDLRGAVGYIRERMRPGDVICHTHRYTIAPFEYYLYLKGRAYQEYWQGPQEPQLMVEPVEATEDVSVSAFRGGLMSELFTPAGIPSLDRAGRIWLVFNHYVFPFPSDTSGQRKVVSWMDRRYLRTACGEFRGISVYLYQRPVGAAADAGKEGEGP